MIVGAGISGLSLGFFLRKQNPLIDLSILEKSERGGGWIDTKFYGDFLFECGPRGFTPLGNGVYTLNLIEELGLEDKVIFEQPNSLKNKYIYVNNSLQKIPANFMELLFSPFLQTIIKAGWKKFWANPKKKNGDESIYSFFSQRIGKEPTELFIESLTAGIFGGDAKKLSMNGCFPSFSSMEKEETSLIRSLLFKKTPASLSNSPFVRELQKHSLISFIEGMETLPKQLVKKLSKFILFSTDVKEIIPEEKKIRIITSKGEIEADKIFLALPPLQMIPLFKDSKLQELLQAIPSASMEVVHLGYNSDVLKKEGFGYLIPPKEKEKAIGMAWDSAIFPQQNKNQEMTRLTIMLGGSFYPEFSLLSKDAIKEIALGVVSKHLNIQESPHLCEAYILKNAIPQYPIGFPALIKKINARIAEMSDHITLLGNGFYGVGVNDCIRQSFDISKRPIHSSSE